MTYPTLLVLAVLCIPRGDVPVNPRDNGNARPEESGDPGWTCDSTSSYPFALPSTSIGYGLPPAGTQGYEVSGVVWHPRLNRLFVVHDGNGSLTGSLTLLDLDGTNVQTWQIGGDFEGVTVADPESNFVYIAKEQPRDSVLQFDFVTGQVTRIWDLTDPSGCVAGCEVDGAPFPFPQANDGIEGITYVEDESGDGGEFYLALEADGRLYRVRLDLSSSTGEYEYAGHEARLGPWPGDGGARVQGLHYDRINGVLWALVGQQRLRVMRPDGELLVEWPLPEPGGPQEGITFANNQCKFVVSWDDGEGGVMNRLRTYGFWGCTDGCRGCESDSECDDGDPCTGVERCEDDGTCVSELRADCNSNGIEDQCDIDGGVSIDCQSNGVPDECDIQDGTSEDGNENDVPDECDVPWPLPGDVPGIPCDTDVDCVSEARCALGTCYAPRQRYLSMFWNTRYSDPVAFRVRLAGGPPLGWVGEPIDVAGMSVARVVLAPVYFESPWNDGGVIDVMGCEISPDQVYGIQAIEVDEDVFAESAYSTALELHTPSTWGDVVGTCFGEQCLPPEGQVGIDDLLAVLRRFQGVDVAPMSWLDISSTAQDGMPDQVSNLDDCLAVLAGFLGEAYPGGGPLECGQPVVGP